MPCSPGLFPRDGGGRWSDPCRTDQAGVRDHPATGDVLVPAPDPTPRARPREPLTKLSGSAMLHGLRGAVAFLEANEPQINDLNVFPVPDGDTGSNMRLTLRAALDAAERTGAPDDAAAVLGDAAHGALLGARGNSGVILSQIIHGLARGIGDTADADARALAAAFGDATRVAYAAVVDPVEGTILSVARACATSAAAAARDSADVRALLERVVQAAHEAVDRTIDQLPALGEAGVVDAGGHGLAVIVGGFAHAVAGLSPGGPPHRRVRLPGEPAAPAPADGIPAAARMAIPDGARGYCTEFIVEGPGADTATLRALLAPSGNSLAVVGEAPLVRVHIHTDAPEAVMAAAARVGTVSGVKVEDMAAQHGAIVTRADAGRGRRARVAVVPVAAGTGFHEILRGLGVTQIVDGGQSMNPSAAQLLDAVSRADAQAVVLLPNNPNAITTARQARDLAVGTEVLVVDTTSVPQGISALLAWDPQAPLGDGVVAMRTAAARTRSLEITSAVRDSRADGHDIRAGDVLGILDGRISHTGHDHRQVVMAVLGQLGAPPEVVTVYYGDAATDKDADRLAGDVRDAYPQICVEVHHGGQPHYPYVLSLE